MDRTHTQARAREDTGSTEHGRQHRFRGADHRRALLDFQNTAGNRAVSASVADRLPEHVGRVVGSPGRTLHPSVRRGLEARFGHEFSGVRVHTDSAALSSVRRLKARAYTVGRDIAYDAQRYAPDTIAGRQVLAHELAHVVQQDAWSGRSPAAASSLEAEAKQAGHAAAVGRRAAVRGVGTLGLQLSPLSDDLEEVWRQTDRRPKKGAILDKLRSLPPGSSAADGDTAAWITRTFGADTDDAWLAQAILQHGPEPLWPDAVLTERHRRARENQWPEEPGHIEGGLGTSAGGRQVRAYYFPGISSERALIIGGVHGSELSGIEVAEMLIKDLRTGSRPYYTVIVVPRLFPDNAARAERARSSGRIRPTRDSNIGRRIGGLDPNRNFPELGESLAAARTRGGQQGAVDAEGRPLLPENEMLLELIQRFRPTRIASVHAKRFSGTATQGSAAPGIFGDPHTAASGASQGVQTAAAAASTRDADLALRMARLAQREGARVPGNWLGTPQETALYGAAAHQPGVSLGGWGPRAIAEGQPTDRPSMTVITVEVAKYAPSGAHQGSRRIARLRELRAHRDALRDVFLAGP